jgi:hypothetical protein
MNHRKNQLAIAWTLDWNGGPTSQGEGIVLVVYRDPDSAEFLDFKRLAD